MQMPVWSSKIPGRYFLFKMKCMNESFILIPIAHIETGFADKFGIPRQGTLTSLSAGTIVFEPEFRKDGMLNEIESFSHLWLIWGFSENRSRNWSVTVRPPKLGGNRKVGILASRSPHRPNPIGLTAVKLHSIEQDPLRGPLLHVTGADMVSGTPIYDIKPYIPYCDVITDASSGYAKDSLISLNVVYQCDPGQLLSTEQIAALSQILSADPRPGYRMDSQKSFHIIYEGIDITFHVVKDTLVVTAIDQAG